MKKIILSVAIVFGLNSTTFAQENSATTATKNKADASPEQKAKHSATWAEKKLTLTPEQKTKWEAASLERINSNKPQRDKMKGSTTPEERKEIHKAVKANNEKFNSNINAFLTNDQKIKWETLKKEKRANQKVKMKGKKGADELELDLEE